MAWESTSGGKGIIFSVPRLTIYQAQEGARRRKRYYTIERCIARMDYRAASYHLRRLEHPAPKYAWLVQTAINLSPESYFFREACDRWARMVGIGVQQAAYWMKRENWHLKDAGG